MMYLSSNRSYIGENQSKGENNLGYYINGSIIRPSSFFEMMRSPLFSLSSFVKEVQDMLQIIQHYRDRNLLTDFTAEALKVLIVNPVPVQIK